MTELTSTLQQYTNKQITLIFYRKINGVAQTMADATYVLYLQNITENDAHITIRCSNGMSGESESVLTVIFPLTAVIVKSSDTEWQVDYAANDKQLRLKLLLPQAVAVKPSQVFITKPTVKEIKDASGKLVRLYLETPEEGATVDFLENMRQVVAQLLSTWKEISVHTTSEELEEFPDKMTFKAIELVSLPGNVFFEVVTASAQGERSFEMATTLTLDFQNSRITYELEGSSYEVRKVE